MKTPKPLSFPIKTSLALFDYNLKKFVRENFLALVMTETTNGVTRRYTLRGGDCQIFEIDATPVNMDRTIIQTPHLTSLVGDFGSAFIFWIEDTYRVKTGAPIAILPDDDGRPVRHVLLFGAQGNEETGEEISAESLSRLAPLAEHPQPKPGDAAESPQQIVNYSTIGVVMQAEGDINVGGDVTGRDKTVTNNTEVK